MRFRLAPAILGALLTAPPLCAEPIREISHVDLRELLATGKVEDPRSALAMARRAADGEVLDIRAFAGRGIYYRVLVKNPEGRVVSLVIDAQSGVLEEDASAIATSVNAAASNTASVSADADTDTSGAAASRGNAGGSAGNTGNGNAGGNGKGNSGGNGKGHGK